MRNSGNELATVQFSAFCGAMLSNNSFAKVVKIMKRTKFLTTFLFTICSIWILDTCDNYSE